MTKEMQEGPLMALLVEMGCLVHLEKKDCLAYQGKMALLEKQVNLIYIAAASPYLCFQRQINNRVALLIIPNNCSVKTSYILS